MVHGGIEAWIHARTLHRYSSIFICIFPCARFPFPRARAQPGLGQNQLEAAAKLGLEVLDYDSVAATFGVA